MSQPLLQVQGVSKRFGGVQALSDVGLSVLPGQVHGLIGPNGAGKTTFFNMVTGLVPSDGGRFELEGRAYKPTAVHKVAQAGIARTFQNIRLFADMSALDNVRVGRHVRSRVSWWQAVLRTKAFRHEEDQITLKARELLAFVGLEGKARQTARTLSYGDQRRLEIARALATEPKLLALDEPAAGMNATEKVQLRELIERIRSERPQMSVLVATAYMDEAQRFDQATEAAFLTGERRIRARALLVGFIITATTGALLWGLYQGTQAVLDGRISAGHMGQTVVYVILLLSSVAALSEVYGDILRAAGATERLMELLAMRSRRRSPRPCLRHRADRACDCAASPSTTPRAPVRPRSRTSTSMSHPVKPSRWWAPAVPARPRCSSSCCASTTRNQAPSRSTAPRSSS